MLHGELLTLSDLVQADAKRRGEEPNVLALARVLSSREPEAFEGVFGAGACELVQGGRLGVEEAPGIEEILEPLPDASVSTVAARLQELLGKLGNWVKPSEPLSGHALEGPPQPAPEEPSHHPLLEEVEGAMSAPGHHHVVLEVLAQLGRRVPGNPLLLGPSGSGRTTFARGLQAALDEAGSPALRGKRIVRLSVDRLLRGNPVENLSSALNALGNDDIAYLDDLEALLGLSTGSFFVPAAMRLRDPLERTDRRIVLTLDEGYLSRLESADADLLDEMVVVRLPQLPRDDLVHIVEREADSLAAFHGVDISADARRLALAPAPESTGRAHPGLAVDRLDAACARAVIRHDGAVKERDLGLADTPEIAPLDVDRLLARLREEVRGQDAALERVLRRLALTRARLDLRPERPDAVLLLVGPTGVGKTQLARTLCRELFGDEERMVRLDMSEYSDSWATSRLIGPQPGYAGYTEPDAWLTTRIRREPRTVLLLDEIEKAHPAVWNTFLQVFDAGRLTDPRGNVANFSETIIVMTSNIGSDAFNAPAIGFGTREETGTRADEETRVLAAVRTTMSPELVNRLDDIVVFSSLSLESIHDIAEREIQRAVARLIDRGYRIEIAPGVTDVIAKTGYEPRFGARHLQRNLERLLLMPLADARVMSLRAEARVDAIVWEPQKS